MSCDSLYHHKSIQSLTWNTGYSSDHRSADLLLTYQTPVGMFAPLMMNDWTNETVFNQHLYLKQSAVTDTIRYLSTCFVVVFAIQTKLLLSWLLIYRFHNQQSIFGFWSKYQSKYQCSLYEITRHISNKKHDSASYMWDTVWINNNSLD